MKKSIVTDLSHHYAKMTSELEAFWLLCRYTPNANMADHSVVARDELHDSEVSQSLMSCFGYASPENSCFVVDLFCLISLCLRVAVFLNATRRDRNIPPFSYKGKCRINTICWDEEKELTIATGIKVYLLHFRIEDLGKKSFKLRAYVVSGGVPTRFS